MTPCLCFCCCSVCEGSEQTVSLTFHCPGFLHAVLQLCGHLSRGIFNVCAYVPENAHTLSKHVLVRSQVGANVCVGSACIHSNASDTCISPCRCPGACTFNIDAHQYDAQECGSMPRKRQHGHLSIHVSIHMHLSVHCPGNGVPSPPKH